MNYEEYHKLFYYAQSMFGNAISMWNDSELQLKCLGFWVLNVGMIKEDELWLTTPLYDGNDYYAFMPKGFSLDRYTNEIRIKHNVRYLRDFYRTTDYNEALQYLNNLIRSYKKMLSKQKAAKIEKDFL